MDWLLPFCGGILFWATVRLIMDLRDNAEQEHIAREHREWFSVPVAPAPRDED